jgi:hypothetical protein
VTLWQGLVRIEGHDWPTNRKPLVAPELKKDQLRRTTLRHPRAQPPVRPRKNRVAPTDLGHSVQGASVILRHGGSGTSSPRHPGTAEQHEPKKPQHVRLEEPVDCLLLGVIY